MMRTGRPRRAVDSNAAPLVARVFAALTDGEFHSGQTLAQALGVSRSAVWKAVGQLEALGAQLQAVRNRGYRLAHGGEALDAVQLRAQLAHEAQSRVTRLETAWSVTSTNTLLLQRPNPPPGSSEVLLAEYQSAGRGRRGRSWLAPPGGAICLSLSWTFRDVPAELGALGLVIGVCILRALRAQGVRGAGLKWPNDILVDGRKLGGVLIELRAESAGSACVVIGIGLNVTLGPGLHQVIAASGLPAIDLASSGAANLSRNRVAAAVISECVTGLLGFGQQPLQHFLAEWREADSLRGKVVSVMAPEGTVRGTARGIDLHGAFLLETPQGVRRFISGDVSVRP